MGKRLVLGLVGVIGPLAVACTPPCDPLDTTAPTLTLPDNITQAATSVDGAVVDYVATATDSAGNTASGTFTVTVTEYVPPTAKVASLSGGTYFTCALLTDGTVRCWGDNAYGQLGDGHERIVTTPRPVVGLP